jgi:hypothetical protein
VPSMLFPSNFSCGFERMSERCLRKFLWKFFWVDWIGSLEFFWGIDIFLGKASSKNFYKNFWYFS